MQGEGAPDAKVICETKSNPEVAPMPAEVSGGGCAPYVNNPGWNYSWLCVTGSVTLVWKSDMEIDSSVLDQC